MAELPPSWMTGCYSPQGDRLMLGNIVCSEGVADVGGGSLLVTTGGSGRDLSIAQGGAWVEGDDDDRGMYSVYNDGPVTRTADANASGQPRIDTVVACVYDSTYGEGADEWLIEILPGTPTGGADLTNLTGAASLVGLSAIPLAYVLVASGEAGPFDAADIRDARTPYGSCESWIDFDPNWQNTGALDAASTHRFIREGDMCTVSIHSVFDAGGAAATIEMDLPLPPAPDGGGTLGVVVYRSASSGARTYYAPTNTSGSTVEFYQLDGSPTTTEVGPTAVDDFIDGTFSYQIAT